MPYSPWTYCNIPTVQVWVYNPFYAMDGNTDISYNFDKTNSKICENKAITPRKTRFCFKKIIFSYESDISVGTVFCCYFLSLYLQY